MKGRQVVILTAALATMAVIPTRAWISSSSLAVLQSRPEIASFAFVKETQLQEEKRLTDEEEEILFGDESELHAPFPGEHRTQDRFGNVLADPTYAGNPLDHAKDPVINKLTTMRNTIQSCPELWIRCASICPDLRALLDEHLSDDRIDVTFQEMSVLIQKSAQVFAELGVSKGMNVAMLAENSARWLMADHGIQLVGGASAVRGADAPLDELRYIYEHSDSAGIVVLQGTKLLRKLAKDAADKKIKVPLGLFNNKHGSVRQVLLLSRDKTKDADLAQLGKELGVQISVFADLLQKADPLPNNQRPKLIRKDLATIVYTSGTTGRPKGVMLTHGNLLHQTGHRIAPTKPYEESEPLPGETMVSLLPVWHITERAFELYMLTRGCSVVYSSIRTFKNDLAKHQPQWMVLVPRVLEKIASGVADKFASGGTVVQTLSKIFTATGNAVAHHRKVVNNLVAADEAPNGLQKVVSLAALSVLSPLNAVGIKLVWKKVQDGFGGQLKVIISGGSALAGSLETFYETAGMTLCVAYGLTECSPLIAYRRSDSNLVTAGCVGKPCLDTEIRIVNPDKKVGNHPRPALPDGEVGVILAKGPQIMRGYYKDPDATAKAIDKFGWFDTGDLGRINPLTGDLILTGRAKDTIVLSNGENIEPQPIEDAVLGESALIDQVMLTGQDGRRLVAITVLSPSELGAAGYLDKGEAKSLQAASDKINDPKCSIETFDECSKVLRSVTKTLRDNADLKQALAADIKRATSQGGKFRAWEQVNDFVLTLEPFAMINGQLTQSYKVKRASVLDRYQKEVPK